MRKILYYSIFGCLLHLGACNSVKQSTSATNNQNTGTSDAITDKKWKLIELSGSPVADEINGKQPFILLHAADSRYSATAGCNGLGGTFSLSGNNGIKFSQGMSTMMACEHMDIETGLNKALLITDNYTVSGNILSLNKARMAPLARFEAVENSTQTHALNGTWELNYISGSRIAFEGLYPGKKPRITFNVPDSKANGNSSCNDYSTTFQIDGNTIKFNDPVSTEMACEGNGEAAFFSTLKTISGYSISGTTLNLIMGDIAVMRLEKK